MVAKWTTRGTPPSSRTAPAVVVPCKLVPQQRRRLGTSAAGIPSGALITAAAATTTVSTAALTPADHPRYKPGTPAAASDAAATARVAASDDVASLPPPCPVGNPAPHGEKRWGQEASPAVKSALVSVTALKATSPSGLQTLPVPVQQLTDEQRLQIFSSLGSVDEVEESWPLAIGLGQRDATAAAEQLFRHLDVNGDGRLSLGERRGREEEDGGRRGGSERGLWMRA